MLYLCLSLLWFIIIIIIIIFSLHNGLNVNVRSICITTQII
jgi:hypothetical protein